MTRLLLFAADMQLFCICLTKLAPSLFSQEMKLKRRAELKSEMRRRQQRKDKAEQPKESPDSGGAEPEARGPFYYIFWLLCASASALIRTAAG
jgi:hypothetical protein